MEKAIGEWREDLIKLLKIDYFNPVVKDWTIECIDEENRQKLICDYNLFVITNEMKGVYSIAEVIDLSNKNPDKTILCVIEDGFDVGQCRSLNAVSELAKTNGAYVFTNLEDVAKFLNTK